MTSHWFHGVAHLFSVMGIAGIVLLPITLYGAIPMPDILSLVMIHTAYCFVSMFFFAIYAAMQDIKDQHRSETIWSRVPYQGMEINKRFRR